MGAYQGNIGEAKSRAAAGDLSVMELISVADSLKAIDIGGVVELYDQFIVHNGEHPLLYAVLFNFGTLLTDLNMLDQAGKAFERAIALNPDFHPAYINLGRV